MAEVRDHSCSLQLAHLAVTSPVCFFRLGPRDTSSASPATWGGGGGDFCSCSVALLLSVLLDAGWCSDGGIPATAQS